MLGVLRRRSQRRGTPVHDLMPDKCILSTKAVAKRIVREMHLPSNAPVRRTDSQLWVLPLPNNIERHLQRLRKIRLFGLRERPVYRGADCAIVTAQAVRHRHAKAPSDTAFGMFAPQRFALTQAALSIDLSRSAVLARLLLRRGSTEPAPRLPARTSEEAT